MKKPENSLVDRLFHQLKKNRIFRFTSSIRLAVPLMLTMGLVVAIGTVIESNYNSDYAKLVVYNSSWFLALLALLFLNILNATLSRYPFKKHHLGFVITHIGLLTLLVGAMVTWRWGIDGSLRVPEGSANGTVILPRLMVAYQLQSSPRPQSVVFDRVLNEKSKDHLDFINSDLNQMVQVEKLIPFAALEKQFVKDPSQGDQVALSFILKSSFFSVSEWLHSKENPEMKMGPATLRLIIDKDTLPAKVNQSVAPMPKVGKVSQKTDIRTAKIQKVRRNRKDQKNRKDQIAIVAKDIKTQKILGRWSPQKLAKSSVKVGDIEIKLKQLFHRATVADNKLTEAPESAPANLAAELEVKKSQETLREVLYAKFPGFSLNNNGLFGITLGLEGPKAESNSDDEDPERAEGTKSKESAENFETSENSQQQQQQPPPDRAGETTEGNLIEFHVHPDRADRAILRLFKSGQLIKETELREGENYQTPWMGMKVYLAALVFGGKPETVAKPVNPEKSKELPPTALLIKTPDSEKSFWLTEGESRQVTLAGRPAEVYFGRETLELPFRVHLKKFSKADYPGTQTAMSFMSQVQIEGLGDREIAMNEPLKHQGFTLYQASYVMAPNQPVESIFSVNHDPGRGLKYAGSLILALGIVIYTFMRSRLTNPQPKDPQ